MNERPMTGLLDKLTLEQVEAVKSYSGPEVLGKAEPKSLVEMVKEASRRPVSDRPDIVSDETLAKIKKADVNS